MAYDKTFRERALKFHSNGNSIAKTARTFGVGTTTIKEWKKLARETGGLEKRAIVRGFKKINPEKLNAYLKEHPDAFLHEIAEPFNCTAMAIHLAMKRQSITRKKRQSNTLNETKKSGENS